MVFRLFVPFTQGLSRTEMHKTPNINTTMRYKQNTPDLLGASMSKTEERIWRTSKVMIMTPELVLSLSLKSALRKSFTFHFPQVLTTTESDDPFLVASLQIPSSSNLSGESDCAKSQSQPASSSLASGRGSQELA